MLGPIQSFFSKHNIQQFAKWISIFFIFDKNSEDTLPNLAKYLTIFLQLGKKIYLRRVNTHACTRLDGQ